MKKNTNIDEKNVCDDYLNFEGIECLSKKYHTGKLNIKEILKKNGVSIRKKNDTRHNNEYVVSDYHIEKYPNENGFHYIAKSKDGNYTTSDYMNNGGYLTSYIKSNYKVEIPSLYERRKYYQTTGEYWWEKWFDIVKIKDEEVKKCPYCEWSTIDVENKSGMFLTHLKKVHNIDKYKHLEKYPEDRNYLSLKNKTKNRQMETDKDNFVVCQICGKKYARLGKKHLSTHGITRNEYIDKFGFEVLSNNYYRFLKETMTHLNTELKPTKVSKGEEEIKKFLEEYDVEYLHNDRKILNGKELDIYIPNLKLAIEYNGLFWHKEGIRNKDRNYHLYKLECCREKGISLIQIYEDELQNKKELVFSKLRQLLKLNNDKPKIQARKCVVREIYKEEAENFLEKNHIQGFGSGTIYLGCFYNEKLIGVMSFKKENNNTQDWELTRFATDNEYVCQGVGGKLFSFFLKLKNPDKVKSFADRRWTVNEENNLYIKLGFSFVGYTKPDYSYYCPKIERMERIHKFRFRKDRLNKKYGFPLSMTETEMCNELGCTRIWNCGLIKYIWSKTKE